MKKIGIVFLVLLLTLTTLGVGYSMWDKTLTVDGTVSTGNVDAQFQCQWMYDNELGPLYAGTSDPAKVYQYSGSGTTWADISGDTFIDEYAVLDLEEYDCHLYAATESIFEAGYSTSGVGKVWRYDGGQDWTQVGGLALNDMDDQVCALEVYNEKLYAGTAWNGMNLYRYNDVPGDWTQVVNYTAWSGTRSLYVSHGLLLMGDIGYDRFGHIDAGESFTADQDGGGWCIYDYEDYCTDVYAAAYSGRLWRSSDAVNWSLVWDYFDGNMWELEVYQAELYMSFDIGYLSIYPDYNSPVEYASDGIISMDTDGQYLYFGTGGEAGAHYWGDTSGISEVYEWDGSTATDITDPTLNWGVGVQVLYVGTECYPYEETKDVGTAVCVIDGNTIRVTLENVYPCYEATLWYTIVNTGNIPIHIDSIVVNPASDPQYTVEVTGIYECLQIDPISWPGVVPTPGDLHIHVLQTDPAPGPGVQYTFTVTIVASQWVGD